MSSGGALEDDTANFSRRPPYLIPYDTLSAIPELCKSFPLPACVHSVPLVLPCQMRHEDHGVGTLAVARAGEEDAAGGETISTGRQRGAAEDEHAPAESEFIDGMVSSVTESAQLLGEYARVGAALLSPAARSTLSPATRAVYDALASLSSSVSQQLRQAPPSSARTTQRHQHLHASPEFAVVAASAVDPSRTEGLQQQEQQQQQQQCISQHEIRSVPECTHTWSDSSHEHTEKSAQQPSAKQISSTTKEAERVKPPVDVPLKHEGLAPHTAVFLEREAEVMNEVDETLSSSITDCVRVGDASPHALSTVRAALLSETQPFNNVTASAMGQYLKALVAAEEGPDGVLAHVRNTSSADIKAETTDESANEEVKEGDEAIVYRNAFHSGQAASVVQRGVVCASCIAHPRFQAAWLPAGVISDLVTCTNVVVMRLRQRLSEEEQSLGATCEKDSAMALVEGLRDLLGKLAVVLTIPKIHFEEGDLLRLEDICFQATFAVAHNVSRPLATKFALYVHRNAVLMYALVIQKLRSPRESIIRSFFKRLPLSDALTAREFNVSNERKVMTVTAMALALAQTLPAHDATQRSGNPSHLHDPCDEDDDDDAKELMHRIVAGAQSQCELLVGAIVNFLRGEVEEEQTTQSIALLDVPRAPERGKTERGLPSCLVSNLAEDLASMIGMPEYPFADVLLRTLLTALTLTAFSTPSAPQPDADGTGATTSPSASQSRSQLEQLSNESAKRSLTSAKSVVPSSHAAGKTAGSKGGEVTEGSAEDSRGSQQEKLRPFVVDLVGRVAAQIWADDAGFAATAGHAVATGTSEDTTHIPDRVAELWKQAVRGGEPPDRRTQSVASMPAQKRRGGKRRRSGSGLVDVSVEQPLSGQDRLLCAAYFSMLQCTSSEETPDAFNWANARRGCVVSWVILSGKTGPLSGGKSALTALALMSASRFQAAVETTASERSWHSLWMLNRQVLATLDKSLLHPRAKEFLVTLLLMVFRSERHDHAGNDVARKRALTHLSRLTELFHPLERLALPIARQCIRDDNARVRESGIPLLQTLLAVHWQAQSHAGDTSSGITNDIISSLVHLLHDRSSVVVARAIAALGALLTDPLLRKMFQCVDGRQLLISVQARLLKLMDTSATASDLKYRQLILHSFSQRWLSPHAAAEGTGGAMSCSAMVEELIELLRATTDAPYEISEEHPVVQLLKEMRDAATSLNKQSEQRVASGSSSAAVKQRKNMFRLDVFQLTQVMRACAREICVMSLKDGSQDDWEAALATLHALAHGSVEWVEPFLDPIARCLQNYTSANNTQSSSASAEGGAVRVGPLSGTGPKCSEQVQREDGKRGPTDFARHRGIILPSSSGVGAFAVKSTSSGAGLLDANTGISNLVRVAQNVAATVVFQIIQILRTALLSPRVPPLDITQLSHSLTELLSKYVGHHQQKILLASCGALSAMITVGGTDRQLSFSANFTNLKRCYVLMNSYYVRAMKIIQTMASTPENVTYAPRLLFLLSAFLRLYPGWRHPHPELAVEGVTGSTPNQLAADGDVCENVHRLVTLMMNLSPNDDAKAKTMAIVLRTAGSLCILKPTVYFRRNEELIRSALSPEADQSSQTQALLLIHDFLVDEDSRVEIAAKAFDAKQQSATESVGAHKRRRDGRQTKKDGNAAVSPPTASAKSAARKRAGSEAITNGGRCIADDQTSGMATWLVQQFVPQIMVLCGHPHTPLRTLAFEALEVALDQGLLPPSLCTTTLIALAAEPVSSSLRQRAAKCLSLISEMPESPFTHVAHKGVAQAYFLYYATNTHLLLGPLFGRGDGRQERCMHSATYELLSKLKRHREQFLLSAMRYFYQQSHLLSWCTEHCCSVGGRDPPFSKLHPHATSCDSQSRLNDTAPRSETTRGATVFSELHPLSFLLYLTSSIAYLPFALESDVLYLMEQCRTGINLIGESAQDYLVSLQQKLCSSGCDTDECNEATTTTTATTCLSSFSCLGKVTAESMVEVTKAFSTVLLHLIRSYLRKEFGITYAKINRYTSGVCSGRTSLPQREMLSSASKEFQARVQNFALAMAPIAVLWMKAEPQSAVSHAAVRMNITVALNNATLALKEHVGAALAEEAKDMLFGGDPAATHTERQRHPRKAARRATTTSTEATPKRRSQRSSRRSSSRDTSSDEAELLTSGTCSVAPDDSNDGESNDDSADHTEGDEAELQLLLSTNKSTSLSSCSSASSSSFSEEDSDDELSSELDEDDEDSRSA